jgi:hypothetical protein
MDDYEMDGIGSDNPALTVPAAQRAPINRTKSHGRQQASPIQSESSQNTVTSAGLSKYDVSQHKFNLRYVLQ